MSILNSILTRLNKFKLIPIYFSQAKTISVEDISGGCGAMYEILVESTEFKNISRVKQHQLITNTLKNEIKDMHGLRIHTSIPTE